MSCLSVSFCCVTTIKITVAHNSKLCIYLTASGLTRGRWDLHCGIWDLVSWPRIEPWSPALKAWTITHWTISEVEQYIFAGTLWLDWSHSDTMILFFLSFFFFFWQHHTACGILVLQSKIKYRSLAVKVQSPNYWNARDSPVIHSGIQSSGTAFLSISFIILVWCLCFTWMAFLNCLMLFGCSLTFKTNTLIRLIRSSARVGNCMWTDRCLFGCWGREATILLGILVKIACISLFLQ